MGRSMRAQRKQRIKDRKERHDRGSQGDSGALQPHERAPALLQALRHADAEEAPEVPTEEQGSAKEEDLAPQRGIRSRLHEPFVFVFQYQ